MANVSFEAIRLAIESRMAQWDGVPVAYDGVPNSPALEQAMAAKSSWVRLTIQHGASFTAGIGSEPCVRRSGLVMLQIFTPINSGSRPAAMLADSLAAHFEYYQAGHFSTQAASVQRIGPQDDWYLYVVSVPFRAG